MKALTEVLQIAKRTLDTEIEGINSLRQAINEDFYAVIKNILELEGRVVITGIGKSAIIGQKIVASLNSTGTPSIFMHAADAIHGDLGIIQRGDLVICISKSGNTPEIKVLVPLLKRGGNILVGMTGDKDSFLGTQSHYVLDTTISQEACPLNLAPTTSTTAQLVMGDMLTVCLLECRSFNAEDFARYHPGGSLGKRLYLTVADIYVYNEKPEVDLNAGIKEVIVEITRKRLGAVTVMDGKRIAGIITDGDIRRMMEKHDDFSRLKAADIMSFQPKGIDPSAMAIEALEVLRNNNITQLIVIDDGQYLGIVHLHDLLKEGII